MMKLRRIAILAMLLALPATAGAADLGPGAFHAGACAPPVYQNVPPPGPWHTGLADQATIEVLWHDTQLRYLHAIEVSLSDGIIFNQSQAYTWAEATKLSCGKAIGYLTSYEANALQLNECDCYYRRMVALLP